MTDGNRSTNQDRSVPESAKKTYIKPSFEFERVFETMALACGKIFATQGSCHSNRKTS